MSAARARRLPVGAEWQGDRGGVSFRVWAPKRRRVDVVFADGLAPVGLDAEPHGYFSGVAQHARVGARYRFRLDGDRVYPDPASRWQPDGPHGPSAIVDPDAFSWTDRAWSGVSREGNVIYEMHVGTFTHEGTWRAAMGELPELARLGVTVIEVMPIAEFPGRFGWGYDGVDLFAPTRAYGSPDDARRFVDAAHAVGLGVILDVVYNHFGPDGNYLGEFADTYVTRRSTEWGAAVNYDGEGSAGVRDFIVANARYWVDEFHVDGLRLDATQDIHDESSRHIVTELGEAVRRAAGTRSTLVIAENEAQRPSLVRPASDGGMGLDALWNDDFHHTAKVALTGRTEAYFLDYGGTPQELVSCAKRGYLFQGQHYAWQGKRRGEPALDLDPSRFVAYLENHDQVANSLRGARLHTLAAPGCHRALVALLLLGPATPLLFQGEEFASSSPFQFFADHNPELAALVEDGRTKFLSQFPSFATVSAAAPVSPPHDTATFERCKLDFSERRTHRATYALYEDLLALRRSDTVFGRPRAGGVDGAILSGDAFVLRFFGASGDDRLLVVNLGPDRALARAPEPLLAPPRRRSWREIWSSENPRYGGSGAPPIEDEGKWRLPGYAAVALRAAEEG